MCVYVWAHSVNTNTHQCSKLLYTLVNRASSCKANWANKLTAATSYSQRELKQRVYWTAIWCNFSSLMISVLPESIDRFVIISGCFLACTSDWLSALKVVVKHQINAHLRLQDTLFKCSYTDRKCLLTAAVLLSSGVNLVLLKCNLVRN